MLVEFPDSYFAQPEIVIFGGGTLSIPFQFRRQVMNICCARRSSIPGPHAAVLTPPRPTATSNQKTSEEDVFTGFFWTSFFSGERRGDGALVDFVLDEEVNFLDEGRLLEVEESSMLEYKPGPLNAADCLSRLSQDEDETTCRNIAEEYA
ncbi:Hypothetical predicted protein [Mytilus galloprovincialis]|uniref:Uncharacterized protein n=1 Tax=Mytilus galloprovincialis TaxID=29158 RepID=A0A8B6F644_MYTGA|nr:Hypothetical predicted protein [Mytilus galloprovincialis]